MTKEVENALDLIDRGLQSVNGTRDVHVQLQLAVQTVRMALLQSSETKEPSEPEGVNEDKRNRAAMA